MQLSILHITLSDGAAKAVCWTLVHSTWEGTAAALLAGLIILGTRKRAAALRYNLLTADLLLFLLGAGLTFYYELGRSGPAELPAAAAISKVASFVKAAASTQTTSTMIIQPLLAAARPTPSLIHRTERYLNRHAPMITLIWLICLSVQLLRLSGGLYQIDRLRREGVAPDAHWERRLTLLAQRLGIKRTVVLLQSGRVHAPSAIGFLKPAILLPLGLLSRLSPDQVEAVLLHELAHIRRSDYLANLLLHLTEALFFFNPGVRWIATLIRREREACCDDMVLAGTPDKNNYFEALVAFMQFSIDRRSAPAYALQLGGGRKTDLTWRIKRMLTMENKRLHLVEKTILSLGLLALVSFGTIRGSIKPARAASRPAARSAATPSPSRASVQVQPTIAPAEPAIAPAQPVIAPAQPAAPAPAPPAPITPAVAPTGAIAPVSAAAPAIAPAAPIAPVPALEDTTPNDRSKTLTLKNLTINFSEDDNQNKSSHHPGTSGTPDHPGTSGTPGTHDSSTGHVSKPPYLTTNPVTLGVIHDLQKEHLIDRLDELSITLTTTEMIVDHVKQPDYIFKRYMTKYLKHPGDQVIFSQYFNSNGSSGSSEKVIIQ